MTKKFLKVCFSSFLIAYLLSFSLGKAHANIIMQESFDTLNDGILHGQNKWISNSGATIQTQFNAQGGGKALNIDKPESMVSKVLVPSGVDGVISVDFKILLDSKQVEPSAKILFSLLDSDKKRITLFFHSEANQWGIKSGSNYSHIQRKSKGGEWQSVRLILNFTVKTVSVYVADGVKWNTVFSKIKFDTEAAKNFASIDIVRPTQFNNMPVYLDEIEVHKIDNDKVPQTLTSVLKGDAPAKPRFAVFNAKEPVEIVLQAERALGATVDTLEWQLQDWRGVAVKRGTLSVTSAKWRTSILFDELPSGYYSLQSRLKNHGDILPAQGSRPAGMLSFGVLPSIAVLPQLSAEYSRLGIWGTNFIKENEWLKGDPFEPLTTTLGIIWSGQSKRWFELEPNFADEWKPGLVSNSEFDFVLRHSMPYVVMLDGIPAWNIAWPAWKKKPKGKLSQIDAMAYPPVDWNAYAHFLTRVAQEQFALRKQYPYQTKSYYLIHHEPDWHWKGSDNDFIKMYQVAHKALHDGDPQAILMGPRYGVLKSGIANLERLFPQGLGKYLDGLAYHGYYLPPRLSQAPEEAGTPDMLRHLRKLAQQYIGPEPLMAQLEWGVRYDLSYENVTPEILRRHAAQTIRGHLIALGEGAQMSYMFYTSDYSGEPGYGITFNLDMPEPNFGAIRTSPKPAYMAAVAMSSLLNGTQTIGRFSNNKILGYTFKRGTQYLLAIWSPNGANTVKLKTTANSVQIFDLMGNAKIVPGNMLKLGIDDAPTYVLSSAPISLEN